MLLIDKMDPQGFIMYRLYKDHMRLENGEYIKVTDLYRLAFPSLALRCLALRCLVLPCPTLPCPALLCPTLPCLASCG